MQDIGIAVAAIASVVSMVIGLTRFWRDRRNVHVSLVVGFRAGDATPPGVQVRVHNRGRRVHIIGGAYTFTKAGFGMALDQLLEPRWLEPGEGIPSYIGLDELAMEILKRVPNQTRHSAVEAIAHLGAYVEDGEGHYYHAKLDKQSKAALGRWVRATDAADALTAR